MKITVKRSGGFAGIQMPPVVLEVDNDPTLIVLSNDAWAAKDESTDHGMDMMQYEITTETEGHEPEVMRFKDRLLPIYVQALVDYVIDHGK